MVKDFIEAERDQNADCARIEAAVRLAERDIAFLVERPLEPAEKRQKWCTIRDRTILAVRDVRHNIVRRATEARDIKKHLTDTLLRERAGRNDARASPMRGVTQLAFEEQLARICHSAEKADALITELFFNHRSVEHLFTVAAEDPCCGRAAVSLDTPGLAAIGTSGAAQASVLGPASVTARNTLSARKRADPSPAVGTKKALISGAVIDCAGRKSFEVMLNGRPHGVFPAVVGDAAFQETPNRNGLLTTAP